MVLYHGWTGENFADLVEDFHFFSWFMYYLFVVVLQDHSDFCKYRLWLLLSFYSFSPSCL